MRRQKVLILDCVSGKDRLKSALLSRLKIRIELVTCSNCKSWHRFGTSSQCRWVASAASIPTGASLSGIKLKKQCRFKTNLKASLSRPLWIHLASLLRFHESSQDTSRICKVFPEQPRRGLRQEVAIRGSIKSLELAKCSPVSFIFTFYCHLSAASSLLGSCLNASSKWVIRFDLAPILPPSNDARRGSCRLLCHHRRSRVCSFRIPLEADWFCEQVHSNLLAQVSRNSPNWLVDSKLNSAKTKSSPLQLTGWPAVSP